ncbi:peptide chain release factor 2 [Desulfonatronum thiosulfatophilum]|uniref:peptide chain release factor 2 n=1 Tax=Desulfonatronum thiosulfatophilum TaxID=617002 RepID=UPI001ABF8914|nr:peptide chain release factor 2 [Desulfonatronum thiosulfatophilum]
MLQLSELKTESAALENQFNSFWRSLDHDSYEARLVEIDKAISHPEAWNDPRSMTPLLQEKTRLSGSLDEWKALDKAKQDLRDWLTMAEDEPEKEVLEEVQRHIGILAQRLQQAELHTLLSAPEDQHPAILEIHPGAGGTEAQDWAEMLLRMYKRWCERHQFRIQLLDYLPGDEAGVKSVVLQIEGPYAYGLLKSEKGIHRLIRISPFDASGRRHTSFASVDVYPDVGQEIEIEINEEDLRIDVFRASGPGGQHVNKTSSAIRITHLPTNIVTQCQNEKSQHRNKDSAMKMLKARLYELELRKREDEKQAQYATKDSIAWGSQIRTYTMQPYRLVKDHRTNFEMGNVEAVLDGDIDGFIRNHLLETHMQRIG